MWQGWQGGAAALGSGEHQRMEEGGRGSDAESWERDQIGCKTWGTCLLILTLSKEVVGQRKKCGLWNSAPPPPSFPSTKIHICSLCARPCAEMNQNQTLLLAGSRSWGRRQIQHRVIELRGPKYQVGEAGHRRMGRASPAHPWGQESLPLGAAARGDARRMRPGRGGAGRRQRGHSVQMGTPGQWVSETHTWTSDCNSY